MIYTTENTYLVGKPVKRVVDANGLEYDYCTYVNTETGEIVQNRRINGQFVVDENNGTIVRDKVKAAPPIIVEFYRGQE